MEYCDAVIAAQVMLRSDNCVVSYTLSAYVREKPKMLGAVASYELGAVKHPTSDLPYLTTLHPKIVSAIMPLLITRKNIPDIGSYFAAVPPHPTLVRAYSTQITADELLDITQQEYWKCAKDTAPFERVMLTLRAMEQENRLNPQEPD